MIIPPIMDYTTGLVVTLQVSIVLAKEKENTASTFFSAAIIIFFNIYPLSVLYEFGGTKKNPKLQLKASRARINRR